MKKIALSLLVLVVVVLTALVVWRESGDAGAKGAHGRFGQMQAQVLDTVKVRAARLPLYLQTVGQAESSHSVDIRPQVGGLLKQVNFVEGSHVDKGQLLFQLDAAPYQAELMAAKAAWDSAHANAERIAKLRGKQYVTDQQYQDAKTAADKALAAYDTARINLGYTRIVAPISGRTGLLSVKSGNLLSANGEALVTINQMQPLDVQFTLPQQDLAQVRQHLTASRQAGTSMQVLALSEDGKRELASGKLEFIGNQVDQASGTFTLKARFANADEALWPGQFVTVQLQLAEQQVLVIPAVALQTGQDGNFVYQVKDGKTVVTQVELLREQGQLALINGLAVGEEVVARVPRNLRVGMAASTRLLPEEAAAEDKASVEAQTVTAP